MFGSIIYVISFSILLILLFIYKKNEKKVNGISYFVFSLLLVWCYEAVTAGLVNLANIPINLLSVSVCDFVASVILLIVFMKKGRQKQEYYWKYEDFVAIAVVTFIAVMIAYYRFDGWFEIFRFKTGDGANHLVFAEDVIRTGNIDSMFFQKLRDSLLLSLIEPVLGTTCYYKIFLAFQTFLFALSGVTFWALIEDTLESLSKKVIGLVLVIIYMLGYPLNNLLYGFTYWGTSILLITLIIYLFKEYKKENISFRNLMIVAFFLNAAICVCYVYFAPIVFGAQFIYVWAERKNYRKEKILYTIFPLFLAGVFCIVYIYFGMFSSVFSAKVVVEEAGQTAIEETEQAAVEETGQTAIEKTEQAVAEETEQAAIEETEQTQIEKEEMSGWEDWDGSLVSGFAIPGIAYFDLYSNFVLLIPFLCIYFWNIHIKRRTDEYTLMTILTLAYIGVQFLLCLKGFISIYYFSKNYNLLWFLCFAIMVKVIAELDSSQKQFLIAYGIMCGILFSGTLLHVDERLRDRDPNMCLPERSSAYYDIISKNLDTVTDRYNEIKMSPLEQELCNEAAKLTKAGYSVAWVADRSRFDDFYAITNQIPDWRYDLEVEYSKVENRLVDYALVSRDKYGVDCDEEYVDNQKRVFENDYGYIIEVR